MVEFKPFDKQYLAYLMARDKYDFAETPCNDVICGVTVYVDGVRAGIAFARDRDGMTTLDGYAEYSGKDHLKYAVIAGKHVLDMLGDKPVYIVYQRKRHKIGVLARALGFHVVACGEKHILWRKDGR